MSTRAVNILLYLLACLCFAAAIYLAGRRNPPPNPSLAQALIAAGLLAVALAPLVADLRAS